MTTTQPPHHEIDWFLMDMDGKWRIFDWRRCNLLENMLHQGNYQKFEMVYRDVKYVVDFKCMLMREWGGAQSHKLRRETSVGSRPIRIGEGRWQFYNGFTWVLYENELQRQLEEKLQIQEPYFCLQLGERCYMFDLDSNSQWMKDGNSEECVIINRQWMRVQQIQEVCKMRKQQDQLYSRERRQLEEYVRQHMVNRKQFNQLKKQAWQTKRNTNNNNSNIFNDLSLKSDDNNNTKQLEEWSLLIEQMKQEESQQQQL